ncbi:fumarylacetoacetate hydrolase family protein [uncultured Methylobacterium sp.]|jgi:2-oxo-3-hexenedioate decarboxylase|uniref:2-keto-4-pentenoate hydratase n=1 Tax=uncultured Methylobacterium sp. TaxID=157278 RepID=UPI002607BCC6|nr:fumarylacetoacetate hydrolase family protein [uncultured Methylobacterium sp.]
MTDDAVAGEILAAADAGAPGTGAGLAPFTDRDPGFDLPRAYRVAAAVMRARAARGERPAGWKIGFTNRRMWDEYGVRAPVWGPVYDTSLRVLDGRPCALAGFAEPRIEPEIVFRLARRPPEGAGAEALLACLDAVALGFEVVQSLYPGWRFRAPDTVAAFALHGCLYRGPWAALDGPDRAGRLSDFTATLTRDGAVADHGAAQAVLGGPLHALAHLAAGLPGTPFGRGLEAGDVVTTGTLTRACPVAPGETWAASLDGLDLAPITLSFT